MNIKRKEYKQTNEQNRAIHYTLDVFWSVRRNYIPNGKEKKKTDIHKNKIKYNERIECKCKNEN